MNNAYALIFDGYADWELGHVLAELRRFGGVDVVTVGFSAEPVLSMGGLRVTPDLALHEMDIQDVLIFILPGGLLWQGAYPTEAIASILIRLEAAGKPIAAICGATAAVVRAGILNGRKHTSNAKSFLDAFVPDYSEGETYIDTLAIRDRQLITASGLGAIEFTIEVFKELRLASSETLDEWYDAFKLGKAPKD